MACALSGLAADPGDRAPALSVGHWIKGKPVSVVDNPGHETRVVLFWETSCPFCREALPFIAELQNRFKSRNVRFIAISPEPAEIVQPFVEKLSEVFNFSVGVDSDRKSYNAYMTGLGSDVIPHAFIIDTNGVVVWDGHVKAGFDQALEEVVDGHFDLDEARRSSNAEKLVPQYFNLARAETESPSAAELGKRILVNGGSNPWLLNNFALQILTDQSLKHRDPELALEAAKGACSLGAGKVPSFIDTYARALFENHKLHEAIATEKAAISASTNETQKASFQQTLKSYQDKMSGPPR